MKFISSETEIHNSEGLSAIYFYADWMIGHKTMLLLIEKIEKQYPDVKFTAIDVDGFKSQCVRFRVDSIPTTIIFKDGGKEIDRVVGRPLTSAFKKVFADICRSYEAEKTKNHGDSRNEER